VSSLMSKGLVLYTDDSVGLTHNVHHLQTSGPPIQVSPQIPDPMDPRI